MNCNGTSGFEHRYIPTSGTLYQVLSDKDHYTWHNVLVSNIIVHFVYKGI